MHIDPATITAIFTGIAALLGIICKLIIDLRKLRRPATEPSAIEEERSISDERIAALESENEALRFALEGSITVPHAVASLNGEFIHLSPSFAEVMQLRRIDDVVGTDGRALLPEHDWAIMHRARGIAIVQGCAIAWGFLDHSLFVEAREACVIYKAARQ